MFRECVELIAFQRVSALGMDSTVAVLLLTGEWSLFQISSLNLFLVHFCTTQFLVHCVTVNHVTDFLQLRVIIYRNLYSVYCTFF